MQKQFKRLPRAQDIENWKKCVNVNQIQDNLNKLKNCNFFFVPTRNHSISELPDIQ